MRAHRVVDALPDAKLAVERGDRPVEVPDLIEFLRVGALRPLDMTVQLWRARRQHEEPDTALLTGALELRLELRSPIHLDRPHWEGHARLDGIQEGGGGRGGGPGVHLEDIPAGDHVAGGEVLEDDAW